MEKFIIWMIDLALWLVMRVVFVTEPFSVVFRKVPVVQITPVKLELPPGNEDLSVALAFAKEYLDDQDHSTGVILEKFKAIMGMYSFSVPILIGFLSSRMVLLSHWEMASVGTLVCIPGFCMMKYFSVKNYVSAILSKEDLAQPFRQQQIDQINWYYKKGGTINTSNNHSVNIYYATQRWLGIALVTLLIMAFGLKFPPPPRSPSPATNIFYNFTKAEESTIVRRNKQAEFATQSLPLGNKSSGR